MPADALPTGDNLREEAIAARYGELLTLRDLAEVLKYSSVSAIRQARLRGTLAVHTQQIRGRKGWFATATEVAVFLKSLETPPRERQ